MNIHAYVYGEGWLTLQSMSTLFHIGTRCSFLCIVQNALADGEASLGLAFALIFQAGTVQDHGYKRPET